MADSDLTSCSHNLFRGQVNDKKNFDRKYTVWVIEQVEYFFPNSFQQKGFKYPYKSGLSGRDQNFKIHQDPNFRQIRVWKMPRPKKRSEHPNSFLEIQENESKIFEGNPRSILDQHLDNRSVIRAGRGAINERYSKTSTHRCSLCQDAEFRFTRISGLYLVSSRESLFRFSRFAAASGGACAEINIAYFCTDAPRLAHIGLRYKPRQAFHPRTHNVTRLTSSRRRPRSNSCDNSILQWFVHPRNDRPRNLNPFATTLALHKMIWYDMTSWRLELLLIEYLSLEIYFVSVNTEHIFDTTARSAAMERIKSVLSIYLSPGTHLNFIRNNPLVRLTRNALSPDPLFHIPHQFPKLSPLLPSHCHLLDS